LAAGDVKYEFNYMVLPTSKNATADIAKGEAVSLKDGRRTAASDPGPFGVAIAAIASGAEMKGKVLIKGVVDVTASGIVGQFNFVKPDANGKVAQASTINVVVPAGSTAVTSKAAQPTLTKSGSIPPDGLLGRALDAAGADGDVITVLLE